MKSLKSLVLYFLLASTATAAEPWENKVYLASYPRSGNHWMRYLIEEATGIATSSVYDNPDQPHQMSPWGALTLQGGFEGHRRDPTPDEIVVIRTHYPSLGLTPFDLQGKYKVVRIVRHPADSFWSWHLTYEIPDREHMCEPYLSMYIILWRLFDTHWNTQPDVYTIRYEDLYQKPFPVLKGVLDFIGYTASDEDIQRAVDKYPPVGGLLKHLSHYTQDQLDHIDRELGDLMKKYDYERCARRNPASLGAG